MKAFGHQRDGREIARSQMVCPDVAKNFIG